MKEAISRILYPEGRPSFIWTAVTGSLKQPTRKPSPEGGRGRETLDFPIWPCSAWGLPCLLRHRRSGALLPHPFTITPGLIRGLSALCGTFPRVTAAGRYPACISSGVRTFLHPKAAKAHLLQPGDIIHEEERLGGKGRKAAAVSETETAIIPHASRSKNHDRSGSSIGSGSWFGSCTGLLSSHEERGPLIDASAGGELALRQWSLYQC